MEIYSHSSTMQSWKWRQTGTDVRGVPQRKERVDLMTIENRQVKRDGRKDLAKVRFKLEASDAAMGVEAELLWAIPLGEGTFKVDNIPFTSLA